jgi:hypothetical protein
VSCKCIEAMNKHLAAKNTRLAQALTVNATTGSKMEMGVRLIVETVKIDEKKRGKPHTALASFCPFCGKKP